LENGRVTLTAESRPETRREVLSLPEPKSSDLLTTLLESCRIRSLVLRPLRLSAPWGLAASEAPPGFVVVLEGSCRLEVAEHGVQCQLAPHDVAMLTREGNYRLLDRSGSRTVPLEDVLSPTAIAERRELTSGGGGAPTRLLCGRFTCEDDYTRQTFALLPPVAVLRGSAGNTAGWFRPLLEALLGETEQALPGGDLLRNHMLQILLIHALRQTVANLPDASGGFLAALRVPGLGATMGAMHARPEHDWSVDELAEMAGLSRAAYAARFLETVGQPPFQYLRNVRMHIACRLLRETEKGIKEIAARAGYATEASFSKAFARWWGDAPGEYRRQGRNGAPTSSRRPSFDAKTE
jgi:AraC-like DNA-binding protein